MNFGEMYIFGGKDIKEGCLNTCWKVDIESILTQAQAGEQLLHAEWKLVDCKGKTPPPISHHSGFITERKLHYYGGLTGA